MYLVASHNKSCYLWSRRRTKIRILKHFVLGALHILISWLLLFAILHHGVCWDLRKNYQNCLISCKSPPEKKSSRQTIFFPRLCSENCFWSMKWMLNLGHYVGNVMIPNESRSVSWFIWYTSVSIFALSVHNNQLLYVPHGIVRNNI